MSGGLKKAYFFDLRSLTNGQKAPVKDVDWVAKLEPLVGGDVEALTVGGYVFAPTIIDGVAALGVHSPINTKFLSQVGSSKVTDVLSEDEGLAKRFAHSTAIAFTGVGNSIVVARGDVRSPHPSSVLHFLEAHLSLGQGNHWVIDPLMDESKIDEFLASEGVVRFETEFTTARDLFDDEEVGPIGYAENMAGYVQTDLVVKVAVELVGGRGNAETRSKLKNVLRGDLNVLARNPRSKTKARVWQDGVMQDLNLVASKMQREFEISASTIETALFSDLLKGVAAVGGEEHDTLTRQLEG